MTELKSIDKAIKGIQYLRHFMKQIGSLEINYPTPLLNDNQGILG